MLDEQNSSQPSSTINKRVEILKEIYTTESTFISNLNKLVYSSDPAKKAYLDRLINLESIDPIDKLILENFRDAIKGIIDSSLINNFMKRMNEIIASEKDPIQNPDKKSLDQLIEENIGTLTNTIATDVRLYFSGFYEQSANALALYMATLNSVTELEKNDKNFKKVLDEIKNMDEKESKLSLSDFIILPAQRPPRYLLFLNDLLKNTSNSDEGYSNLEDTRKLIGEQNDHLNSLISNQVGQAEKRRAVVSVLIKETNKIFDDDFINSKSQYPFIQNSIKDIKNDPNLGALEKLSKVKRLLKKESRARLGIENPLVKKSDYNNFIEKYEKLREMYSKMRMSVKELRNELGNIEKKLSKTIVKDEDGNEIKSVRSFSDQKALYDHAIEMLKIQQQCIQVTTKNLSIKRANKPLQSLITKTMADYTAKRAKVEFGIIEQTCNETDDFIVNHNKGDYGKLINKYANAIHILESGLAKTNDPNQINFIKERMSEYKWGQSAAVKNEELQRQVAEAARKAEAAKKEELQRQAAEAAKKEELQRQAAEAAKKQEESRRLAAKSPPPQRPRNVALQSPQQRGARPLPGIPQGQKPNNPQSSPTNKKPEIKEMKIATSKVTFQYSAQNGNAPKQVTRKQEAPGPIKPPKPPRQG